MDSYQEPNPRRCLETHLIWKIFSYILNFANTLLKLLYHGLPIFKALQMKSFYFRINWVHNMICYLLIHPKFRFWKVAPESNSITFFREGSTNNYVRNEAAAGGNGKINVVESIPREKRKQVFSECSHFIVLPSDFEIPLMHRAHLGGTLPNLHRKIGLLQYYDFNGINVLFEIHSTHYTL